MKEGDKIPFKPTNWQNPRIDEKSAKYFSKNKEAFDNSRIDREEFWVNVPASQIEVYKAEVLKYKEQAEMYLQELKDLLPDSCIHDKEKECHCWETMKCKWCV